MEHKMADEMETYEERVLAYLKGHEDYFEHPAGTPRTEDKESQIQYIMKDLLIKLNRRVACKDRYENLKQWHNQFPLFDLENFIPDFCMDEDMIDKLSFRETLLISELDTDNEDSRIATPNPVGALCLNIQAKRAVLPEGIKQWATDRELDMEVLQTLQRGKEKAGPLGGNVNKDSKLNLEEIETEVDKKLREYETILKNEMYQNAIKFIVHLSSQFSSKVTGGSRITAWVDRKFHTLEEKRTEFTETPDKEPNEKSLYIALQHRKYYVKYAHSLRDIEEKKFYSLAKARNLIGEGANFLLMRYLAITKYVGTFELSTTYINGDMCRNIYECTGPMLGMVNNESIEVCKIYRYIIEECGLEHICCTVMTVYGRIVTQEWDGCSIIINLNPLQHIAPGTPSPYDRLCLNSTWSDDMELFSTYLDSKTNSEMKMKTYLSDHPEVKDILADYLNNILLMKPHNILSFTVHFFESLCPLKFAKLSESIKKNL